MNDADIFFLVKTIIFDRQALNIFPMESWKNPTVLICHQAIMKHRYFRGGKNILVGQGTKSMPTEFHKMIYWSH